MVNPCPWSGSPAGPPDLGLLIEQDAVPFVAGLEICNSIGTARFAPLIDTAHDAGLRVSADQPFPALLLGADEIRLSAWKETGDPIWNHATGVGYGEIGGIVGQLNTTVVTRLGLTAQPKAAGRQLLRALGQGAQVVPGSAAPLTPHGLGLQEELRLLAASGLQPFQILKMATFDAARVLGAGEDLGRVESGKLADLVIVDGDPLADIGEAANVVFTIINGRPYTIDELQQPGGRAASVGKFYN
jgi:hypothetical protein